MRFTPHRHQVGYQVRLRGPHRPEDRQPTVRCRDLRRRIDNPYLPLLPGTVFHYRSETPDGLEPDDVVVTRDSKQILGVNVTVVHDQVFLDGELAEDTFDWFAQDTEGNVWYFGEDSKEIEDGQVVSPRAHGRRESAPTSRASSCWPTRK